MAAAQTFYLSRILGNKVWSDSGHSIGKLLDLIVDVSAVRPKVIAVKIKTGKQIRIADFSCFSIAKRNKQYHIECNELKDKEPSPDNTLYLVKHVLDKQIVDMYGRKVVRVNDLRLVILSGGVFAVAVDVGFEGLLRRLGIAKPLKMLLRPLGVTIPSELLLWDEVETIDFAHRGIKLAKSYSKLSMLHPSDLADIIEDLDRSTQLAVFSSLDIEQAVDVLEELETRAQIHVIESLSTEKAATMLEKLPSDEAADILDEMDEEQASEILQQMEREASEEVRELMDYPEKSVGSLMTTDFISFRGDISVNKCIQALKTMNPDSEALYELYIVDEEGRLIACVPLSGLILAEPEQKLYDIMDRSVVSVADNERIETVNELMSKYNKLAVPVLDEDRALVGVVPVLDVLYNLMRNRKRKI